MHEALEEQRRGGAVRRNGLHRARAGRLVKANRINLQRAGRHDAEPRWVAAIGKLFAHFRERTRIDLRIAAGVHQIEQRRALMLGDGRQDGRVVALLREQVEVVELLRLRKLFVEADNLGAAVGREALLQRTDAR